MKMTKNETKIYPVVTPEIYQVSDIDFSASYSYAHYLKWKFEDRLELIRGKVFKMAAPTVLHQRIVGRIYVELFGFLRGQRCEAFISPFDVRFSKDAMDDTAIFTVVQPDIAVICDQNKLDERGCIGAPDLVVEVLSSGNSKKELVNKYNIYQEFGVREYWIVNPVRRLFLKHVLNQEGYFETGTPYGGGRTFVSDVLPGFMLNIEEIFEVEK